MKSIPYPLRGNWLINDEGAALVMDVWETAHSTGRAERIALALEQRDGQPLKNERNCVVTDGVAIMSIDGPLMRKAELFTDISGATSYQWIGATVDALRMDASVKKVVIKANSPGGEAAGVGECAEKIARLATEKHVEGYVETQAASAMLWLLVQCSHITAHPTAQIGWIGAIRTLVDSAKRDEMNGEKKHQIVSKGAEEKRTSPVDAAALKRVQAEVDEFGRLFTEAVAIGRGVDIETVLADFGRGAGMFAEQAQAVGLIDAMGDFESVIADLTQSRPATMFASRNPKGRPMALKDAVRTADADNEWKCGGCSEMMGPSATRFCSKCAADDGDDDEEDAKALGLDPKAPQAARRMRMSALVGAEARLISASGSKDLEPALVAAEAALRDAPGLRTAAAKAAQDAGRVELRSVLERGLAGAPGHAPRLSLGMIQKTIPTSLRGESKKSWLAVMEKLSATADTAKSSITAAMVIDAACSVSLSGDDMAAVREHVESLPPVAAANHIEPHRDGVKEGDDLSEVNARIDRAADQARAQLDRNNPKPAAK